MTTIDAAPLLAAGRRVEAGSGAPLLLTDPDAVYFVASGNVEIFSVPIHDGRPAGARDHYVTVRPGQAFFGFDPAAMQGWSFVASAAGGTEIRCLRRHEVARLASDPHAAAHVAQLVDTWVLALSADATRNAVRDQAVEFVLAAGRKAPLEPARRARAGESVVWVDVEGGSLRYTGMAALVPGRRTPFPLTEASWVELAEGSTGTVELAPRSTIEVVRDASVWAALDLFHRALCECEVINKRRQTDEEIERLESKALQSEAAQEEAFGAIGSVLAGRGPAPERYEWKGSLQPVLDACRAAGEALGIEIEPARESGRQRSLDDEILAIAAASRCRTRRVALRDDWWRRDQGPLVAALAATQAVVALLPTGPAGYEAVDPAAGTRLPVTPEMARSLVPFAYSFYRPLPSGAVTVRDLARFGLHGLGPDVRTIVVLGVFTGLLGIATPYLIGRMVDGAIPNGERGALVQFGLAILLASAAVAVFRVAQGVAVVRVETRMDYSLQAALWDRLLGLPTEFFRRFGAGDLADRAAGISAIRSVLAQAGVTAILGSLSSLAYLLLMACYSLRLTLVAVLVALALVALTTAGNRLQLRHQREEAEHRGRVAALVLQLITGVTKVRVAAAENHAFRVWAEKFAGQKRTAFRAGQVQNVVSAGGAAFTVLSSLVIFGSLSGTAAEGGTAAAGALTTGSFVAFFAAFVGFVSALQSLSAASLGLLETVPLFERLTPILEAAPESDETKEPPGELQGEVTLSHVRFRYSPDGPWILDDVSLEIGAGQFVAFVGPSGSGKSTLLRLLLGFEQPQHGTVKYDGQDLAGLDLRAVRRQLGVVLQQSQLLPTDIFRNIVGTGSRTMQEAWEAAEMAGLADDIREMPMQMHTVVSEGGGTFSGGQKQRLLIARAIVNKPRVLIFDEATSAIDNRAQAFVTESLKRLDATRIVVAHRLSTIVEADRIFYLEGGRIREEGTYQELVARNGLFAELACRQIA
jgi:ATP-binding cassette subfamily C protein